MNDLAPEQAWAAEARAGSADAFRRLVQMHQQGLRAFLRRLTGNHADADDIAQEAFVFAWEHIGRFDASRPFRSWLFGIAWRKHREHKRGWLRLLKRETRAAENTSRDFCSNPGLGLDLTAALKSLSPEQKAAVLLCLMAEFTHMEAAEVLALPLGTVKSHIARGREKLVTMLGGSDG
ncbi:MAG TPA: RNA polymerase sigma factor [Rhizomicrobium sp.]|nr:RNA polymerase sigma factor [Rhizomicrobium sp.]